MIMKFQSSFLFPRAHFIKSQTKQKTHSLVCSLVWTTHSCRKQESCTGISALRRTPWSQSDFHTDHFSSSLEHHSLSKDYQRKGLRHSAAVHTWITLERDLDQVPINMKLLTIIWINMFVFFFLSSKQSSPTRKSKDNYSAGKTGKIRLETDLPYSWGVS